ncbi:MAG: Y-family DNA polymerase [Planctomycetaceae bacterium]
MNPRWLAIWLTDWPIQRLRNADRLSDLIATPDAQAEVEAIRSSPVVLWREDSRRGRVVVAACPGCQAMGIKPHQPLHEATDLLAKSGFRLQTWGTSPESNLKTDACERQYFWSFRHDPLADREALDNIANLLQQHISPLVAIEPDPSFCGVLVHQPQTLLVDITGSGDWFGGEQALLAEAHRVLAAQGLQARMAIASNSAAAWALVHFWVPEASPADALASTTADEGQTHPVCGFPVTGRDELRIVGELPTRALRLDTQTAYQLDRLGLHRIIDVLALPRDGLATRLGSDLLRRLDEITGKTPQTLALHRPAVEESAVCELEYPTSDRCILEHRLRLLVDRLSTSLAARRRGALRLACRLEMTQHSPDVLEIGLFIPTTDTEHLSRLLIGAIERYRLPSMVQRITLEVTLGGPLQPYQPMLFGDDCLSQIDTRRTLARMIETLAGRLGRDAVVGIEMSRNPLPEAACRLRPLAGESRSILSLGKPTASRVSRRKSSALNSEFKSPRQSNLSPAAGPLVSDPLRRPLRIFAPPQPLEVIAMGNEGVPQQIRFKDRVYQVTRHWGPERIETGWWDGPQIRRDYYRIEIDNGNWWWIFCQLRNVAPTIWKLHGQFI